MILLRHEGVEQKLRPQGFANLRELLDDWGSEPEARDCLVVAVSVDRQPLAEDELERLEEVSIGGENRIEIESRSRRGLALESLESCRAHCEGIRGAVLESAESLRTGRVGEANQVLVQVAESFGVLASGLSAVFVALAPEAGELRDFGEELIPWLRILTEAQGAGDWVRVADCLEFEIGPLLEQWQMRLATALETLAAENAGGHRDGGVDARS